MGLMDDLKGKVNEMLEKTDIDEKIVAGVSELKDSPVCRKYQNKEDKSGRRHKKHSRCRKVHRTRRG